MEQLCELFVVLSFFALINGSIVLGAQMLYFESHFMQEFLQEEQTWVEAPDAFKHRKWLAAVRSCRVCQLPYACWLVGLLVLLLVPP